MDIIKKNILSFICAIVAIIALIASFWPLGGQYDELRADLDKRKSVFNQIDSLIKKERTLPTVTPPDPKAGTTTATQQPLPVFPNPEQITKGEAAVEKVHQEGLEMIDKAVELNEREQLVPDALPELSDQETFSFTREYRNMLTNVLPKEVLQAASPPTQEDVDEEAKVIWERDFAPEAPAGEEQQAQPQPGRGGAAAGARQAAGGRQNNITKAVQDQYNEAVAKLPEQMQQRVAKENKMYIDPLALDISKFIPENQQPDTYHIWYAQVGLWIQQDVANSLAAVNANAENVLDAPVKRLMKIDVIEQQSGLAFVTDNSVVSSGRTSSRGGRGAMPGMMGMGMGGYDSPESSPAATPGGAVPKDFTLSPTGRISSTANSLYDVAHFELMLVVDAAKVAQVLEALSREKLVTVLRVDELLSVDPAMDLAEGYIYGERPVVKLSLLCEALFLREWTTALMPERVKQELGVQPPPADPGAGGGVAGAMR